MDVHGFLLTAVAGGGSLLLAVLILICFLAVRRYSSKLPRKPGKYVKTCIILGPGGHFREMLTLLEKVDFVFKYKPVLFIIGVEDKLSAEKLKNSNLSLGQSTIKFIRRSRHVGQSYFTSIFTTLNSLFDSLKIILNHDCDLVICNGPGTCIPPMIAAFFIHKPTIVFVESFCRTKSLSLSGKIAYHFADHVLVQWPELCEKYPKCKYIGLMV